MDAHDLKMAIAEKPIAVVLGPNEEPYVIDHHVAYALMRIGVERAPYVLLADWSAQTEAAFWLALENRSWTSPYDAEGRRLAFIDMPAFLEDAQDDDFRSLAAAVRDAGAYAKTAVPLADFRWAALFRSHFDRPHSDADYAALIERAGALARSRAAIGLPGYIGL